MSYESKIADFTIDDKMGGDQKVSLLKVVLLICYSNRNTILQILPTYKHFNVCVKEKDMTRPLNLKMSKTTFFDNFI